MLASIAFRSNTSHRRLFTFIPINCTHVSAGYDIAAANEAEAKSHQWISIVIAAATSHSMRNFTINFPPKSNLFSFPCSWRFSTTAQRHHSAMASVLKSERISRDALDFFHIKHLIDVLLASGCVQITARVRESNEWTLAVHLKEIYFNISLNLVPCGF